ncbi:MAG: hypothetical protein ACRELY_03745 [Polyangiaceae bacterium]
MSELPPLPTPQATPRARAAWRAWLEALAVDAEAAIAAALTYGDLEAHARDVFLDAIDEDAETMRTPRIAIYAPLLAVESDPARRLRLTSAITRDRAAHEDRRIEKRAFAGKIEANEHLTVLLLPLYLGFCEVLACRWSEAQGVSSVAHEPLRAGHDLVLHPVWEDVALAPVDFDEAVEGLAHAVVTSCRLGGEAPAGLVRFADLFSLRAASA